MTADRNKAVRSHRGENYKQLLGDKNERGDFDKFVESVNAFRRCTLEYENFIRE